MKTTIQTTVSYKGEVWTYLSDVGIRGVGGNALVVYDVLEGVGHEATLAAIVAIFGGTVQQILWAEGR